MLFTEMTLPMVVVMISVMKTVIITMSDNGDNDELMMVVTMRW